MPSIEEPQSTPFLPNATASPPPRDGLLRRLWGRLTPKRVVDSDNWQVGLCPGDAATLLETKLPFPHWIDAPTGHYFADPFLIEVRARTFLFVEDWDRARRKGSIAVAEVVGGVPGAFRTVLEEDHHLSYPFVLEATEGLFMIPEQGQSGAVHLYEAVDFPWRWRRGPQLVLGEFFEPHPLNPVSRLSRRCRPAGRTFCHGDTLYRPAQFSEGGYGRGLLLYSVDELSRTQYRESLVRSLSPWPDRDGVHHVSSAGGLLALDANRYRRERVAVAEVLAAKFRSLMERPR